MKKYLLGLALALGMYVAPTAARATVCTIPNTIANGTVVDATPVQQNFNALVSCSNNIDWQNIDATGIFASQIIPTTPGQATFGGSVSYTFNSHVTFVQSIVVDSTASPPTVGIAGGNTNNGFWFTSNAGTGAGQGFKFFFSSSTPLPSGAPVVQFNYGSSIQFEVLQTGDGVFNGGVAIDGQAPDGSSLIGGIAATPFWLKSEVNASAASNFAFLDSKDTIPAIVVEKSGGTVIWTLDGIGDGQFAGALAVDNATPGPNGISGGHGTTPFTVNSDTAGAGYAFSLKDVGGNTNILRFVNSSGTTVTGFDQNGGISIGASGQTVIEPTSASFGGAVTVPTAGANNAVCTDSGKNLIGCANGASTISVYDIGSATPIPAPIIIKGQATLPISHSGGGPYPANGGNVSVSFPGSVAFANTAYSITVTGESRNIIYTVSNKTTAGFQINGDVFSDYTANITVDFTAVGK